LSPRRAALCGEVAGFAGAAMQLWVDGRLDPGTAIKVEWEDTLVLGEVFSCQPSNGRCAVGVRLEHSVLHTADLARLASALTDPVFGTPLLGARAEGVRVLRDPSSGS